MTRKRFWVVGLAMVIITFLAAACSGAASSSGAPSAAPNYRILDGLLIPRRLQTRQSTLTLGLSKEMPPPRS